MNANANTKPQPLVRSGASMQPRRSTRLAAKPQVAYLQAELRLDAAVEKAVDPEGYAAAKLRKQRRREAAAERLRVDRIMRAYKEARIVRYNKRINDAVMSVAMLINENKALTAGERLATRCRAKSDLALTHPTWTESNLEWALRLVGLY